MDSVEVNGRLRPLLYLTTQAMDTENQRVGPGMVRVLIMMSLCHYGQAMVGTIFTIL